MQLQARQVCQNMCLEFFILKAFNNWTQVQDKNLDDGSLRKQTTQIVYIFYYMGSLK